jgi:hypothetical protein
MNKTKERKTMGNSISGYVDNLLGYPVVDKVTGFTGIVTSVSFDLYGCVQVIVSPPIDKDGKRPEAHWFDEKRLRVTSEERVMPMPCFDSITMTRVPQSERVHVSGGGQDLPMQSSAS